MRKCTCSLDVHKHYTKGGIQDMKGNVIDERYIRHERGAIRDWLRSHKGRFDVAVEAVGNWYWVVDEIEEARKTPLLVNPGKAKKRMAETNKTDDKDWRGMNMLQRCHSLPTVWIPPREIRDLRELTRVRMTFVNTRTRLKNIFPGALARPTDGPAHKGAGHATLAKHCMKPPDVSDIFGPRSREELVVLLEGLPAQTRFTASELLEYVGHLIDEVAYFDERIREAFSPNEAVEIIQTLPGVGLTLAVVIWVEIGDVNRFGSSEKLATYSGTTPKLTASGGRQHLGHVRRDVNHYLKWAFVEAANVVCMDRRRIPERHVSRLYERVSRRRNHFKAIVAVARHLAEATYWMLRKHMVYTERTR